MGSVVVGRALNGRIVKLVIPIILMVIIVPLGRALFPMPATIADAYGYTLTAQRIVADGFYAYSGEHPGSEMLPNARVTPGWPFVLAGIYSVTGVSGDPVASAQNAHSATQTLMFLISLALVLAVTLSARLVAGENAGLLAGILAALYLPFTWAGTVNLSEHMGTMLFAWQILLAVKLGGRKHVRDLKQLFLYGIVVAVTLMFRPHLALWSVVPLGYLVARRMESPKRLLKIIFAAAIGFCLIFAPWWARNAVVLGIFVPVKTDLQGKLTPAPVPASSQEVTPAAQAGIPSDEDSVWAETNAAEDIALIGRPWVPFLDVLFEDTENYSDRRIEYTQGYIAPARVGTTALYFSLWYHRGLLFFALLSLLFIKKAPRLAMLALVPLAVFTPHWFALNTRYLYPMMPAVVIMAAVGIYGAFRSLRANTSGVSARRW